MEKIAVGCGLGAISKTLEGRSDNNVSSCDTNFQDEGEEAVSCLLKSNQARSWFLLCAFLISSLGLSSCKLYYAGEEFSLVIEPDESAAVSILYTDIGSEETLSHLRAKDLQFLKDLAQNSKYVSDAAEKGVTIKTRRLDFTDFSTNGYVEAMASDYESLFKTLTNYELEVSDRIYITPLNGTVTRATLSEGGEIVVKNKRYTFAWPKEAKEISFKASYRVSGSKFIYRANGSK